MSDETRALRAEVERLRQQVKGIASRLASDTQFIGSGRQAKTEIALLYNAGITSIDGVTGDSGGDVGHFRLIIDHDANEVHAETLQLARAAGTPTNVLTAAWVDVISAAHIWTSDPPMVLSAFASGALWIDASGNVTLIKPIIGETPAGAVNDGNMAYTLAQTPFVSWPHELWKNNVHQRYIAAAGTDEGDYFIAGNTITYEVPPVTGDVHWITYWYAP